MTRFLDRDLDRLLREERPRLDPGLRAALASRAGRRAMRAHGRLLAAALVAGVTVGVGSVGGLGYAATGVKHAAGTVKRVFVANGPQVQKRANAGSDQYQPGFGFGDPNHNHTGPPGLEKQPEPPPPPKRQGGSLVVSTTITLTEQAILTISVVAANGTQLAISQAGSSIGGEGLSGPPAKSIRFTVLVPRALDIRLAVPLGDSNPGDLTIRVTAVDVDGNKSTATESVDVPSASLKTVGGTEKADVVPPSKRSDEISTGSGNDTISTGGGNDVVDAGGGNDTVIAVSGNNKIDLGPGNDRVTAGAGKDRITGGPGRDQISAGAGDDTIDTRDRDRDLVNGGRGRDICIADPSDILISCEIQRIGTAPPAALKSAKKK